MPGTPQSTRVQLNTRNSDFVVETDSSNLYTSQPTVCSSRRACEYDTRVFRTGLTFGQTMQTVHQHSNISTAIS
jgi:hypothetical protein